MKKMENLRLAAYQEVAVKSKNISLVLNEIDQKIYVKKVLSNANPLIFKLIKEHPHQNLVQIHEMISLGEDGFVVIEQYLNGQTLEELLEARGCLPFEEVLAIAGSLCAALEHLHSFEPPVIHRDIKLSNVMQTDDGMIKLIDYDISRLRSEEQNQDTHILGTAGYAAPEQFGFTQTDPRSDIYSLGILLNYLLTGVHIREQADKGWLAPVIKKCTELAPEKRYASAGQVRRDLLRLSPKRTRSPKPQRISRFFPPGFRSGSPLKAVFAIVIYLLALDFAATYRLTEAKTSIGKAFDTGWTIMFLLSLILLYNNYLNVKDHLPFFDSKFRLVRFWGGLSCTFLLYLVYLVVALFFPLILNNF